MKNAVNETLLAKVYDVAVETPLEKATKLSNENGLPIYLKREDLQPVHSFKIRGAYNKMVHLTAKEKKKGVIAASAGNHAQGVALSAQKLDINATIVMPKTTPSIKVDAVKTYDAEVILWGDSYSDAYEHSQELVKKTGQAFIHPFDDPLVIAGQGTVGREIIEQLPDATHIFIPVGGGGLISGIAQFIKQLEPHIKIIGVEPKDSNAMGLSLKAGKRIQLDHVGLFADGVAVKEVGENTFKICQKYVDEVITVTNDQISAGIKAVFEDTRNIVEPAGALGVAGASKYFSEHSTKNAIAVAICSGANMTFERLQYVAERTLVGSGKEALFSVEMPEQAGALEKFCLEVVNGHAITEFSYRLNSRESANIFVGIGLQNLADKEKFMAKMTKKEYKFEDLSSDELVKKHVRHMIGGVSTKAKNEHFYEVLFPERAGALTDFLRVVASRWNISTFHYRGQGSDTANILVSFETSEPKTIENDLEVAEYQWERLSSKALAIFLK